MEQGEGIYLFKTIEDAEDAVMNWLGEEFDENEELALLEINLPPDVPTSPTSADYEVVVADPIPPSAITVLKENL